MKIVVGLGNPGPKYRGTRHNVGFDVLDALASALGAEFLKEKHQGLLADASVAGARVLLVKPLTFMNRSGDCAAAVAHNKIDGPADLLAVTDDVNLPLGRLRIRAGGSAGGHNGLKSLIERLGSDAFSRLRMGVGDERASGDLADHVLARFLPEERPAVESMVERAVEAAICWIGHGTERAANEFNQDKK
jgi:PTH1 family peptidyl-tRNA hydrolase